MSRGFSLIEAILVLVILVVLGAIVLVAIRSPAMTEADVRNAQRHKDVVNIMNALYSYVLDNKGAFPKGITKVEHVICRSGTRSCHNGVDLTILTDSYIKTLPVDPLTPVTGTGTAYTIVKNKDDRVTVRAPMAEDGAEIRETR